MNAKGIFSHNALSKSPKNWISSNKTPTLCMSRQNRPGIYQRIHYNFITKHSHSAKLDHCFIATPQASSVAHFALVPGSTLSITVVLILPLGPGFCTSNLLPPVLSSLPQSPHTGLPGARNLFGSSVRMKLTQYPCMRGTIGKFVVW